MSRITNNLALSSSQLQANSLLAQTSNTAPTPTPTTVDEAQLQIGNFLQSVRGTVVKGSMQVNGSNISYEAFKQPGSSDWSLIFQVGTDRRLVVQSMAGKLSFKLPFGFNTSAAHGLIRQLAQEMQAGGVATTSSPVRKSGSVEGRAPSQETKAQVATENLAAMYFQGNGSKEFPNDGLMKFGAWVADETLRGGGLEIKGLKILSRKGNSLTGEWTQYEPSYVTHRFELKRSPNSMDWALTFSSDVNPGLDSERRGFKLEVFYNSAHDVISYKSSSFYSPADARLVVGALIEKVKVRYGNPRQLAQLGIVSEWANAYRERYGKMPRGEITLDGQKFKFEYSLNAENLARHGAVFFTTGNEDDLKFILVQHDRDEGFIVGNRRGLTKWALVPQLMTELVKWVQHKQQEQPSRP
jgi:hypothetical protein